MVTAEKDGKIMVMATSWVDLSKKGTKLITITNQANTPVPPAPSGETVPVFVVVPVTVQGVTEQAITTITVTTGIAIVIQKPVFNPSTGESRATADTGTHEKALKDTPADAAGIKTITYKIPKEDKAKAYVQDFPSTLFSAQGKDEQLKVDTEFGTVTVPVNMLNTSDIGNPKNVSFTIAKVDKSELSSTLQAQLENSPIIDLSLQADGKTIEWNNPNTPVKVSIPYVPTAAELANRST